MISEGSCDSEDWSNDAENSALITETNYILKYIKIENSYFKLQYFTKLQFFLDVALISIYMNKHIYIYIYVCVCVCVYIYMSIGLYIRIHTHTLFYYTFFFTLGLDSCWSMCFWCMEKAASTF